jgi:hypothetical protein
MEYKYVQKNMNKDYSKHTLEELENTKWLDLDSADANGLQTKLEEVWEDSIGDPQITYTGKIDIDFSKILSLDPEDEFFHTLVRDSNVFSLHQGCADNMIGKYDFPVDHEVNEKVSEKFGLTKTGVQLLLQRPANIVGVHYDKYGKHIQDGKYDFSETLTKQICRGVIFCTDWEMGQVFLSGTEAITQWKQGDTYTFPWYMPHGSANASDKDRYLLRFMGELTEK